MLHACVFGKVRCASCRTRHRRRRPLAVFSFFIARAPGETAQSRRYRTNTANPSPNRPSPINQQPTHESIPSDPSVCLYRRRQCGCCWRLVVRVVLVSIRTVPASIRIAGGPSRLWQTPPSSPTRRKVRQRRDATAPHRLTQSFMAVWAVFRSCCRGDVSMCPYIVIRSFHGNYSFVGGGG